MRWMPLLFIAVILILASSGIVDIWARAAESPADPTLTVAELKDRLGDIKWMLTLIMTVAGLFTVAQGVATGFSAQSFRRDSEKALEEAKKESDKALEEAKKRYRVLEDLELRRKAASQSLRVLELNFHANSSSRDADEGFDWRRHYYERMDLKSRQGVLSTEKIFPYDFIGQDDPVDLYAGNLRRLSHFYWAKFIYEWAQGMGNLEDKERAEYLLDLAVRKIGYKFYLLNDLGDIQMLSYQVLSRKPKPEDQPLLSLRLQAIKSFKDSLSVQGKQQRAYCNLAYIEASMPRATEPQSLLKAIGYLNDGLKYENWEDKPSERGRCTCLYNLACYHARILKADKRVSEAEASNHRSACLKALEEAAKLGMIDPGAVDVDFATEGGDFSPPVQVALASLGTDFFNGGVVEVKRALSSKYVLC
jgi:hypothetical protein